MIDGIVAAGGDEVAVPCAGCRECCWHDRVAISPGDDLAHLDTVRHADGALMLRKREDGACVHLGPEGCTVHEHRPRVCRVYDCRMLSALGMTTLYDAGRKPPVWLFDIDAPAEEAAGA